MELGFLQGGFGVDILPVFQCLFMTIWLFIRNWDLFLLGALAIRALLFWVYVGVPKSWKFPYQGFWFWDSVWT